MREGGAHLARIRRQLLSLLQPGCDLLEVEEEAQRQIRAIGAVANFARVDGYGFATCLMVNDEVVHGKPRHYSLQEGDLVTIDVGLEWQGWQLDTADSRLVSQDDDRFLSTARQALKKAISMATVGRHIGHISQAIQRLTEEHGYSVVRNYCGHGIGRKIHEEPQIFCYLDRPVAQTPVITAGMTLAIEVMMNEGAAEVVVGRGGWGTRTADGSRSVQLEHTVLVTPRGPEILTR